MTTDPSAARSSERRIPATVTATEREMLENWLGFHRETLAAKCAGLDDAQLREASAPPSGLSLLGLVKHMADVERQWFRRTFGEQDLPPISYTDDDLDGDFRVEADDTPEGLFASWREEIAEGRKCAEGHDLDAARPNRHGEDVSLRWIYVHMIEEYARHNGHADLIRERIDGDTGV